MGYEGVRARLSAQSSHCHSHCHWVIFQQLPLLERGGPTMACVIRTVLTYQTAHNAATRHQTR
jgi:hypothetical protein